MLWILLVLAVVFAALYLCARYVFTAPRRLTQDPYQLPAGASYRKEETRKLIDGAVAIPCEEVTITNREGMMLRARYYAGGPDAPLQIMVHGYRGSALRDFSGGLQLALDLGCSALVIDQRAQGKSGGTYMTFGVKERYDCLDWVAYATARWPSAPIILTGISMGAATVLMASALELPENVVGVIADCGYTSPRDILRSVIGSLHLPVGPVYAAVRLAGRLFCGFDVEAASAEEALRRTSLPILFIHGEADDFVPCDMTRRNYAACASEKVLLTVPGAGHGLSFTTDYAAYRKAVSDFLIKYAK